LDQVTDPRNIGAIIRAATVFGSGGLIMTRHSSPASGGALAKTASGALEKMPLVRVANLARCLESLTEAGYLTCGLDEEGTQWLGDIPRDQPIACVMGAEGKGLRRLTKENCAQLVRLTATDASSFATLNVATATAVALYEIVR
jgi:23S rRNA (guanosine2251-2'-O)-methyltransferase